ncbi:hypothetical protein [Streptomyces sp. NPDC056361]|uniref:hypothetical protein n=1 Tax=Streptomyces sp. NPDC056361 TaxID=3345795 RepID=UPI0035DD9995
MSIKTKIAKLGAVAATGTALTVLASGAAFAGSNGQQLRFYDHQGDTYSISVAGYNQNGQWATACFNTPNTDNYIGGWWWKGDMTWIGYSSGGCSGEATTQQKWTTVPASQSSDWWGITQ